MSNRIIAIGDIHGCDAALRALLDVIKPDATDTLVTLGDYVDRGPNSAEVIHILTDLISTCRLVPLLGNHEIMMINAMTNRREFEFWVFNGGKSTLQSYGGDLNNVPQHHRTFLNHCQKFYETDGHIFVHAAYDPGLSMAQQPDDLLFWQHVGDGFIPDPHISGKQVICGHTPQLDGEIADLGHIRLIDTFCYGDKWLTAINVETGEVLQSSSDGVIREPYTDLSNRDYQNSQPKESAGIARQNNVPPADAESDLLSLEYDGQSFRKLIDKVSRRLADHLDHLDDYPVHNSPAGAELIAEIDEPIPQQPVNLDLLLDRLFDKYIPATFNTASPGYLAYIPGGGLPESAVADLIAKTTNRYVSVWNAAPPLAQIESTVVRWLCEMVGYGPGAGGFLTTGGSIANLSAIIAARVNKVGDDFGNATIYASNQTHHCIDKAAFMAGFPKINLRRIPVDNDFKIDMDELQTVIDADRSTGFQPLMVVANAGTTNTGAVDDIPRLRQIADQEDLWLHVDAAYGGFFMLTERGREIMRGIDGTDSIVLDPHKGMFVPYGTGCLLVKRRDDLLPAFQFTSEYMPAMTGDRYREDFCEISPELSRDNRGLRIWIPVKMHGIGVFERLLDEKLDLIEVAHKYLVELGAKLHDRNPRFAIEITAPPQLSIVSFRLTISDCNLETVNALNLRWIQEINRYGSVMLTGTTLNKRYVLRICVLSFRTHLDRLEQCLAEVAESALKIVDEFNA